MPKVIYDDLPVNVDIAANIETNLYPAVNDGITFAIIPGSECSADILTRKLRVHGNIKLPGKSGTVITAKLVAGDFGGTLFSSLGFVPHGTPEEIVVTLDANDSGSFLFEDVVTSGWWAFVSAGYTASAATITLESTVDLDFDTIVGSSINITVNDLDAITDADGRTDVGTVNGEPPMTEADIAAEILQDPDTPINNDSQGNVSATGCGRY